METNKNSTFHKWDKAIGTSFHGHEFLATIKELKDIFSNPDVVGDKEDKGITLPGTLGACSLEHYLHKRGRSGEESRK